MIQGALIAKCLRDEAMSRITSIVNEFSLLNFRIFCIITSVGRQRAEAHRDCCDDLLHLIDIVDDALWAELIKVAETICFLK